MRYIKVIVFLGMLFLLAAVDTQGQVYLKTEYIMPSSFKSAEGVKLGGKGGLTAVDGGLKIPVSVRMDENNRPTAWTLALGATYASLNVSKLSKDFFVSEILNAQLGMMHIRPLNTKWSLLAVLGVGIFTSGLDKIDANSILGQGGLMFVRHARPNFDWGVGIAINNALGYPMLFPSFYLNWELEGTYEFQLSMYNSFDISLSRQFSERLKVSVLSEVSGLMAAVKVDGKSKYFVTQYGYLGVQPEYRFAPFFSIFATCGFAYERETYFQEKTLKAFFDAPDEYPHFDKSVYLAVGLKYGF